MPVSGNDARAAASVVCMPDDSREEPEDEFRDLLRQFLAGNTDIDPAQLASAAGLPDSASTTGRPWIVPTWKSRPARFSRWPPCSSGSNARSSSCIALTIATGRIAPREAFVIGVSEGRP